MIWNPRWLPWPVWPRHFSTSSPELLHVKSPNLWQDYCNLVRYGSWSYSLLCSEYRRVPSKKVAPNLVEIWLPKKFSPKCINFFRNQISMRWGSSQSKETVRKCLCIKYYWQRIFALPLNITKLIKFQGSSHYSDIHNSDSHYSDTH